MLPVTFDQANFTFGKPASMTDEQCASLHVWRGQCPIDEAGTLTPVIISKWQPSKEDIEAINKGGAIYLSITGSGMPPVSLFTENPFIHEETKTTS